MWEKQDSQRGSSQGQEEWCDLVLASKKCSHEYGRRHQHQRVCGNNPRLFAELSPCEYRASPNYTTRESLFHSK